MKKIDISTKKYPATFTLVDDEDFEWLNQWKWCGMQSKCGIRVVRTIMKYEKPKVFVGQVFKDQYVAMLAEKGLTVDDLWCELVVLKKIIV